MQENALILSFFFFFLLVELFHQLSQALEVLTDAAAKVRPLVSCNL